MFASRGAGSGQAGRALRGQPAPGHPVRQARRPGARPRPGRAGTGLPFDQKNPSLITCGRAQNRRRPGLRAGDRHSRHRAIRRLPQAPERLPGPPPTSGLGSRQGRAPLKTALALSGSSSTHAGRAKPRQRERAAPAPAPARPPEAAPAGREKSWETKAAAAGGKRRPQAGPGGQGRAASAPARLGRPLPGRDRFSPPRPGFFQNFWRGLAPAAPPGPHGRGKPTGQRSVWRRAAASGRGRRASRACLALAVRA